MPAPSRRGDVPLSLAGIRNPSQKRTGLLSANSGVGIGGFSYQESALRGRSAPKAIARERGSRMRAKRG